MKIILAVSLVLLAVYTIPSSFAWDGLMAMDADGRNVDRGQIISYKGYLYGAEPIDGQIVVITVYERETGKLILKADATPSFAPIKYFGNTAWQFTFQVGTSFKGFVDGMTYVVEATYEDKSTKLDFFIQPGPEPSCLEMLGDEPIMVLTDRERYGQGDTIRVSGCLSEEAFTKGTNIIIYDPDGNKIGASAFVPNPDRTFSDEFIIDGRFGLNGTYSVEVDAGGLYSSTKSFVVPEFGSITIIVLGISLGAMLVKTRSLKLFGDF